MLVDMQGIVRGESERVLLSTNTLIMSRWKIASKTASVQCIADLADPDAAPGT